MAYSRSPDGGDGQWLGCRCQARYSIEAAMSLVSLVIMLSRAGQLQSTKVLLVWHRDPTTAGITQGVCLDNTLRRLPVTHTLGVRIHRVHSIVHVRPAYSFWTACRQAIYESQLPRHVIFVRVS